jgi:hypothetical protein
VLTALQSLFIRSPIAAFAIVAGYQCIAFLVSIILISVCLV